MGAKDSHRLQKRQAKAAKRAHKERDRERERAEPSPYSGNKYHAERWVPHVYQTELAIFEGILQSSHRLTNEQVKQAIVLLINQLRAGVSPHVAEGEAAVPFVAGQEVEFLIMNIRRHWTVLFVTLGPVNRDDLIGILRTLLHSIEAHGWNSGRGRGYVDFLVSFMRDAHGPPAGYYGEL